MKLINFVNQEYRMKTAGQILTEGNTDGQDGLSWNEVNTLIRKGHNPKSFLFSTAKFFVVANKLLCFFIACNRITNVT